jgi:hypothetical protein
MRSPQKILGYDETRIMSAVSALETSIGKARKGPAAGRELDLFLRRSWIDTVPLNAHQLELARDPTAATAKDIIALHSTSATGAPTPSRRHPASRCCSKATISPTPTS